MDERRNRPEYDNSPKKWRYNFSKSLFTFWKNVKMYGDKNDRITEEITFFKQVLDFFFAEKDELSILFDGIDIKVDKVRIRGQRQDDKYFEDVYDMFLSLCMSGITFKKGVRDEEILMLLAVLGKYPVGREPKIKAYERVRADLPQLDHIEIYPYDPEESGNLPIYTPEQSVRQIYCSLARDYGDICKMIDAAESIPLRMTERRVQDLISIVSNTKKIETIEFMMFLASIPSFEGSTESAFAVSMVFWSVLIAKKLKIDMQAIKRIAVSAYFQYFSKDKEKGYSALSRMDEFNYDRIEAAVNASYRISDFSDTAILSDRSSSSGTLSGEILKVVSYFSAVTRKWPANSFYKGPCMTRPQAMRSVIRNCTKNAFNKEIAEAFFSMAGIYPIGSFVKLFDGNVAVVIKRFKNFFEQSEIIVLDKNLSIGERKTVTAESILDIPDAAGAVLPEKTIVEILNTFLDERELSDEKSE
ncbi:hypothetical protein IKO70_01255 [bacterium]|nr:hypothetical protein [bacterium]